MQEDIIKKIVENHNKWSYGNKGQRANLSGIDLIKANFSRTNLWDADFSKANLTRANFCGAYLVRTNFSGAYLQGANFNGADFTKANFYGAYLQGAIYSVTNLLKVYWDIHEKNLIIELMAHDAESCGIKAMDKWAKEGSCPFKYSERDYYFPESQYLWLTAKPEDKIPKLRGRKLLETLAKACEIKL